MAACYLSLVPPEIILHIIDVCPITDALAFTSTCRALFQLGNPYIVNQLWAELLRTAPHAEDALIAVHTPI